MPSKPQQWFIQIEALLYNYKGIPIRLKSLNLQRSLIMGTGDQEALNKLDHQIEKLNTMAQMVESSIYRQLDPDQQELVKRVYYERQPWQAVGNDLAISKNKFYREKNRIIEILAYQWGYIPANQDSYK